MGVKGFEGLVFRGWGLGFGGVEVRHEEYGRVGFRAWGFSKAVGFW